MAANKVASFVRVKKASELQLDGIAIECEYIDGYIGQVTLTDGSGHIVRFSKSQYDSLPVFVPAKPKTEKRHVVAGTVAGLKVEEVFETEYDARNRQRELEALTGSEDSISVSERDVPVEL
jgi:hypothetical protein